MILNSLYLPFRFWSIYEMLSFIPKVIHKETKTTVGVGYFIEELWKIFEAFMFLLKFGLNIINHIFYVWIKV